MVYCNAFLLLLQLRRVDLNALIFDNSNVKTNKNTPFDAIFLYFILFCIEIIHVHFFYKMKTNYM